MGVGIDDAGRQIFAAGVDHGRRRGRAYILAHRGDLAILDIYAAVFNVAVRNGHDDGILDHDFVMRRQRRRLLS